MLNRRPLSVLLLPPSTAAGLYYWMLSCPVKPRDPGSCEVEGQGGVRNSQSRVYFTRGRERKSVKQYCEKSSRTWSQEPCPDCVLWNAVIWKVKNTSLFVIPVYSYYIFSSYTVWPMDNISWWQYAAVYINYILSWPRLRWLYSLYRGFLITVRGHSPSSADITIAHTVVGAVAS